MAPDPELVRAALAHVGPDAAWTRLSPPGAANAVWRAAGPGGRVVVKRHAHARGFSQELGAYTEWLPRLVGAPRLLGRAAAARVLVLSEETGAPAPTDAAAHAAAGRFARSLHALACVDADPTPLVTAVARRLEAWDARAAAVLTPAERAALARLTRGLAAFAGTGRAPCHRDFTPANWLSHGTGVTVIDFEHARLDAPEVDLVKLEASAWTSEQRAAFFAGYGPLDASATARLEVLLALHATATLAWAHRHGDATFERVGRQALSVALARA